MTSLLIINGPNLNMLGTRQQSHYGTLTWDEIYSDCQEFAKSLRIELGYKQSNSEGEVVDFIQQASDLYQGIVLNAGAFTHTSIALVDAILAVDIPVVEVHMSNIYGREEFRKHSYISPVALGGVFGFGKNSYLLAIQALHQHLQAKS